MVKSNDLFDMPEPVRLMVAGDWHGNSRWAVKALKHARLAGCDTVLHLGDFGFWPRWPDSSDTPRLDPSMQGYYKGVIDYCQQHHLRFFWIDGNHEAHNLLNPGMGDDTIRHLPRGHRWRWWNKTWMAVGGGVSVDKKWRRPNIDWFSEETLTPRQFEHCMRDGSVDIVVAHDTPVEVNIPGIHAKEKLGQEPSFFPVEAIADSWDHRGLMSEIAKAKHPAHWFHGHYHHRYNDTVTFSDIPCQIVGLDKDATHLNLNTVILTKEDLTAEEIPSRE